MATLKRLVYRSADGTYGIAGVIEAPYPAQIVTSQGPVRLTREGASYLLYIEDAVPEEAEAEVA